MRDMLSTQTDAALRYLPLYRVQRPEQRAFIQEDKEEASRVIFMGWPGQHELEDDRAAHRSQHADGVTGSGGLQPAPGAPT